MQADWLDRVRNADRGRWIGPGPGLDLGPDRDLALGDGNKCCYFRIGCIATLVIRIALFWGNRIKEINHVSRGGVAEEQ